MKIADMMKAKSLYKKFGADYDTQIEEWKKAKNLMQRELNSGIYEMINIKTDDSVPSEAIFYEIKGTKVLGNNGIAKINSTIVDGGDNPSIHIQPAYLLIKDTIDSTEEASVNNTTLFKVTYHEAHLGDGKDNSYFVVDRLLQNTNENTSELFPYIIKQTTFNSNIPSIIKTNNNLYSRESNPVSTVFPDFRPASDRYSYADTKSINAFEVYKNEIVWPLYKFALNPMRNIDFNKAK